MISQSGSIETGPCSRRSRGRGLVPVPGLWIDGGDHPVLRDPPAMRTPPRRPGRGPDPTRWPTAPRPGPPPPPAPPPDHQQRMRRGPARRPARHGRPCRPSRMTGLPAATYSSSRASTARNSPPRCARGQQPADRRADQCDRVHRGHRVIQRRRVQHPPPAHQAAAGRVKHLRRSGPARRPRQPRAHVHQHRVHEPRVVQIHPPAAYFHRASNANRSTASRSLQPSRRCSTITTATTRRHARRPTSVNKSANISSGNSRWRSRCSKP